MYFLVDIMAGLENIWVTMNIMFGATGRLKFSSVKSKSVVICFPTYSINVHKGNVKYVLVRERQSGQ